MRYSLNEQQCQNLEFSSRREWLLPNGIGGYAMGTASGLNTRRYHGHLIAATTPPTGRTLLLATIDASIETGNNPIGISANQYPGAIYPEGLHYLRGFSVDEIARWRYRASGFEIEKSLKVHRDENALTIAYTNLGPTPAVLILRPLVCHRDHHGSFYEDAQYPTRLELLASETLIEKGGVTLHIFHPSAARTPVQGWYYRFEHQRESDRGLPDRDDLFCPCELRYTLGPGEVATLVASTRSGIAPQPLAGDDRSAEFRLSNMLRSSAERFFVVTEERSSIIAGFPWFTDWGRDTMISLPGLCLHTGRIEQARQILRAYASQMQQGLIPNRFVETGEKPEYNTVDATLWFVNAAYKTLEIDWHDGFAGEMMEALREIFVWHNRGTSYGIGVDASDGLLTQGVEGVQLTWMDAKIGDWVVTPRHGKPVEINGLWINALRAMERVSERLKTGESAKFRDAADLAVSHFEAKFWRESLGFYLDTADPDDASLRPNQVIAMALPLFDLDPIHVRTALGVVARELLTPNGLRTLAPDQPGYKPRFQGPINELDAAYHQGTAWPWLLGSYCTALVKSGGKKTDAKRVLRNAKNMLEEYGLGGIAEVYDADEPQQPGGCPYQAWSVAELLRSWIEDVGGD